MNRDPSGLLGTGGDVERSEREYEHEQWELAYYRFAELFPAVQVDCRFVEYKLNAAQANRIAYEAKKAHTSPEDILRRLALEGLRILMIAQQVEIHEPCPACGGKGEHNLRGRTAVCHHCGGTGHKPDRGCWVGSSKPPF